MGKDKDKPGRDSQNARPTREGRPQDSMGFQKKRPATTDGKYRKSSGTDGKYHKSDDGDPEPRPWESKAGDGDEQN